MGSANAQGASGRRGPQRRDFCRPRAGDTRKSNALESDVRLAYGTDDRIDPWVGGLAETHLPGSSLGATLTRIIVDQFARLRDGDRF